jgi:hypothetical protein
VNTALIDRLSVAARAVLEALPIPAHFHGPTASSLAGQVELLASTVEELLAALWGFDDSNVG